MPIFQTVGLMLFVVLLAVLLIRYVHLSVDREFQNLARAVSDAAYRGGELERVDRLLDGQLPIGPEVGAMAAPASAGARVAAPILLFLGIALLWGGVFAQSERRLWLGGAAASCLAGAVIMLVTLRRRKWERLARLLRFRADLRRMDGDRAGSAADLSELVKLTPWDDAAWAELSDDRASRGRLDDALESVRQASRLDPRYDEYRMLETSLAIRLGRHDMAHAALKEWAALDDADGKDPRLSVYRAALELAEGKREDAVRSVEEIAAMDGDLPLDIIDADQALAGVKELLPAYARRIDAGGDDVADGESGKQA